MSEKRFGVIRSAFTGTGRLFKGMLGFETIKTATSIASSGVKAMQLKSCPRCHETTLGKDQGQWHCATCGYAGTDAEVEQMASVSQISPGVMAAAKGRTINEADVAQKNKVFSWVFWCVAFLVMIYSVYWLSKGQIFYFIWTLLMTVWVGTRAIKFAFNAQYLLHRFHGQPRQFISHPGLWFVR